MLVAEGVENRPQSFGRVDQLDADGRSFRSWLEHPGPGHVVQVIANVVVIQHRNEIRHANSVFERLHAHGELVAEIAHGGQPHAGDAHVLAQGGGSFHVELVERDDAVNLLVARQISYRLYDFRHGQIRGHIEDIVQAFARPIGIAEFLGRKQEHAAALALAFAHEFLSLFVGGDAEKGERRCHESSNQGEKYTTAGRWAYVGRTLLSDAFDLRSLNRKRRTGVSDPHTRTNPL